ncbi:hypothetical protein AB7Z36_21780, partial [Providencia rettgeri]
MGSCAAPSAKGDDKFITTDYLQQCPIKCDLLHQIHFLTWACSPVHSHRMLLAMSVPRSEQHHEFCLWLV